MVSITYIYIVSYTLQRVAYTCMKVPIDVWNFIIHVYNVSYIHSFNYSMLLTTSFIIHVYNVSYIHSFNYSMLFTTSFIIHVYNVSYIHSFNYSMLLTTSFISTMLSAHTLLSHCISSIQADFKLFNSNNNTYT